ncbi:hypothetical protein [Paenibacillus apiarius]|uniref:Uncharacterized protein n=1 Tax=Paenibacillus apiarius TaxID=46240 RepID=A0ABT4DQ71_9BACL|nr:hypothetical protein [Paenibacillus apiarius]MCY9515547.1 hypothetical protein [Paenibacillus apiarius]MCY9519380.1 hypothetical protein [Paenibacillus apiarius]MCY9551016.1 hypothetical protein [Paenibacillus apiarius]MCY9558892.1 hypothetical protein [Paenibacillus apiarius]MCY9685566.1 hypothetical protein [Paenibacillus apiarius]
MSKLIKITAIILGASMIFISLPSQTEATVVACYPKVLEKTEKVGGKTKKYYKQICRDRGGKVTVIIQIAVGKASHGYLHNKIHKDRTS